MLEQLTETETIVSQIETLDLNRTFDAVVLGSHLINTPDDRQRHSFLKTCLRHVSDTGLVLIEAYVPARIRTARNGFLGESDGIRCSLSDLTQDDTTFSATITYEAADAKWAHSFTAKLLERNDLALELSRANLAFGRWLNGLQSWFSAHPVSQTKVNL
jgi:hypothetical protein